MRRFAYYLILIALVVTYGGFVGCVSAQTNLVPNPSFETLSACPTYFYQLPLATGWFSASRNAPDILNSCSTIQGFNVAPVNPFAPQPKDGNGYLGILLWYDDTTAKQFAEIGLSQTLIKEKKYYVSFYTSPSKYTDFGCDSSQRFYTDVIGASLTVSTLNRNNVQTIPATIEHKGALLNDPKLWYHICGLHKGSGEKYITIGNFEPTAQTKFDTLDWLGCAPHQCYYFVDLVSVYEFSSLPDTLLLCPGTTARLGGRFLDATYLWSTGSTDSIIVIDSPGIYIESVYIDGCGFSDTTVVIRPDLDAQLLPHDTIACLPLALSVKLPGSYEWSDSSHADTINISTAGEYGLTVTNICGTYSTDFQVTGRPCECHVFVPNAFTPNGDGTNDIFQPGIACDFPIRNIRCIIADRWGEIVYSSTDEDISNIKWDGTYKDKQQEPGIYILLFEYAYLENGTSHTTTMKGSITLIR